MSSKFDSKPQDADYAKGGGVITTTSQFLKTPDQFTDGRLPPEDKDGKDDPEQDYEKTGKTGKLAKRTGGKSLKAIVPKS